jgi:predicted MPP superfamily phosphohydrolase
MPPWLLQVILAVVSIAIQAGFHLYVWKRLVRDTGLSPRPRRVATIALVVLGLSLPLTFWASRLAGWIGGTLGWVSFGWMALLALTVVALAAVDVVRLVVAVVRRVRGRPDVDHGRRQALARIGGGVAAFASVGAVGSGVIEALGDHQVVDVPVTLPGLGAELDGFTIVQITDLHVGNTIGRRFVGDLVERVNGLRPDLIAVTGDMVDGTVADLRAAVAPLAQLRAPHGVWFVPGNHEYYAGIGPWLAEVARLGMTPLRNQRVEIRRGAARFDLAGVDDHSADRFGGGHGADYARALDGREPGVPCVLLAHQPRQVHAAERFGVDLQLSGHTHGGQIWPWHYIVSIQQGGLIAGRYQIGRTQLYVSRGAGYWGPPVRVAAPLELTRVILRAGSPA